MVCPVQDQPNERPEGGEKVKSYRSDIDGTGPPDSTGPGRSQSIRVARTGIPNDEISLVASNLDDRLSHTDSNAATGAAAGGSIGGVLGGGAGLLAGLGMLAIPGVGPVVAAGWLVATAVGAVAAAGTGAVAGGLIGSLTEAGVSEDDAHVYLEGVRRGGTLVTARIGEDLVSMVEHRSTRTCARKPIGPKVGRRSTRPRNPIPRSNWSRSAPSSASTKLIDCKVDRDASTSVPGPIPGRSSPGRFRHYRRQMVALWW